MKKAIATVLISGMLVGANMYGIPIKSSLESPIYNDTIQNRTNTWGCKTRLGGKSSFSQNAGFIDISIFQCGNTKESNQIYCDGFELYKNGKYCLEFDIYSSVERMIEYRVQNAKQDENCYVKSLINVDQDITRVVKTFIMKDNNDCIPRLVFNLGNFDEQLDMHDIQISNIRLYLVDDSKIELS